LKPDYWLERWQEGRIGFHRATENPALVRHHGRVLGQCVRVLVPLCGKSADLEWLVVAGHEVVGIELSELAAQAFFSERGFAPERREQGPFVAYQYGGVTILTGDFFAASEDNVGLFDGVYDRAALIALPEEMRARYAQHLPMLLTPKAKLLLLTLEFDAPGGPPFSVPPAEVQQRYAQARITLLDSADACSDAPGPVERGATFVSEHAHLVEFP
jgi:thiopurine S-methyltransferase